MTRRLFAGHHHAGDVVVHVCGLLAAVPSHHFIQWASRQQERTGEYQQVQYTVKPPYKDHPQREKSGLWQQVNRMVWNTDFTSQSKLLLWFEWPYWTINSWQKWPCCTIDSGMSIHMAQYCLSMRIHIIKQDFGISVHITLQNPWCEWPYHTQKSWHE